MKWDKFRDKFHPSWHDVMKPFIESPECDQIYAQLKFESGRGKTILPASVDTFRCFKETPRDEMKVVMLGMGPYHTLLNDNQMVADGLLMGCSYTKVIQPSLSQFYKAIEKEFFRGFDGSWEETPDVSYLAHQGVLMFNASLTVELGKAGSHLKLWEPFTKYMFEEVFAPSGIPIIFLGKDAAKFRKYMAPMQWGFVLTHPASASYKGDQWSSEGAFKKVNKILEDRKENPIQWLKHFPQPFEYDVNKDLADHPDIIDDLPF